MKLLTVQLIQRADAQATNFALPVKAAERMSLLTHHEQMFLPLMPMKTEVSVQLAQSFLLVLTLDGRKCFLLHRREREDD
jgi:hypothetical protein